MNDFIPVPVVTATNMESGATASIRVNLKVTANASDSSKSKPFSLRAIIIAASKVPRPPGRIGIAMPMADATKTVNTPDKFKPLSVARLKNIANETMFNNHAADPRLILT